MNRLELVFFPRIQPVVSTVRVQKLILTNFTELSCSSETNRFSASQEILCILWKPLVHYRIHNSPPPVPILNQIHLVHVPSHFLKMHFNIIYPSMPGSSKRSPCFTISLQNLACTSPLPNACYIPRASHSSRFDIRIFGEQYRSLSSSLYSLLHSPVTSSVLGPNILLGLYSNILSAYVSPSV
jgi:hypothetical protein